MQQYSHHDKYTSAIKGEALPPIGIPNILFENAPIELDIGIE